jgi:DNA polymerase I-like protein with 3'-5' exonuclease and polymerase domains
MTLGSLMYKLNMKRMEAAKITDQYWAQFPRIKPWMDEIVMNCKTDGYLRYWSGRLWREENVIDMYKGVNALIQGGCADLLSIAAIRVDEWNELQQSPHSLVNLVHDETITEIPVEDIGYSAKNISSIMQVPDLMTVPFATDVKVGLSYGVMEKIPKEWLKDEGRVRISLEEIFQYAEEHTPAGEKIERAPVEVFDEEDLEGEEEEEEEAA